MSSRIASMSSSSVVTLRSDQVATGASADLVDLVVLSRPRALLLASDPGGHRLPPHRGRSSRPSLECLDPRSADTESRPGVGTPGSGAHAERVSSSSRGGGRRRRAAPPTCARVPRTGSSVGTRCSASRPGMSKMTESHDAAATLLAVTAHALARGSTPGCPPAGGSLDGGIHLGVGGQPLERARADQTLAASPFSGRTSAVLQVDELQSRAASQGRCRRGRDSPAAGAASPPSRARWSAVGRVASSRFSTDSHRPVHVERSCGSTSSAVGGPRRTCVRPARRKSSMLHLERR